MPNEYREQKHPLRSHRVNDLATSPMSGSRGRTDVRKYYDVKTERGFFSKYQVPVDSTHPASPNRPLTARDAGLLKIKYDLFALCGVAVPKSYIEKAGDDSDNYYLVTSEVVGGVILGSKVGEPTVQIKVSGYPYTIPAPFRDKKIEGKPIKGLFENLAVFAFMCDWDAIGGGVGGADKMENILLVDKGSYWQAVKIDPEYASLSASTPEWLEELNPDLNERGGLILPSFENNLAWNFRAAFHFATTEEKLNGIKRIVNLKDDDLHRVIFNEKIGDEFLSQEERQGIFDVLVNRRDTFRRVYANELEHFALPEGDEVGRTPIKSIKVSQPEITSASEVAAPESNFAVALNVIASITMIAAVISLIVFPPLALAFVFISCLSLIASVKMSHSKESASREDLVNKSGVGDAAAETSSQPEVTVHPKLLAQNEIKPKARPYFEALGCNLSRRPDPSQRPDDTGAVTTVVMYDDEQPTPTSYSTRNSGKV